MVDEQPTLTELANKSEVQILEDRWLNIIERDDQPQTDMLDALEVLNKNNRADLASTLAWTWLTVEMEKSEPIDILTLGKEALIRCGDSEDIRNEIIRLYEEIYAQHPGISDLIRISGLKGGKTPRRALRAMDICLELKEGDFLVSRSEDRAAQVTSVDTDTWMYTVRTPDGTDILDPDELTLNYDPTDANDIRILIQLNPERLTDIIDSDPLALIIGILKSRHGQIDSDELEHLLCPKYISDNQWKQWWADAKRDLKRCPNVVVEGRNPVILSYHREGRTLEYEIEPQWKQAETAAQRLDVIETYFREAKHRKTKVQPELIERMHSDLLDRVNTSRKGSPSEALIEALINDRLIDKAKLPDDAARPAKEIIAGSSDIFTLMGGITEVPLYLQALKYIKEIRPDDWLDIYARLLPVAPINGCNVIADTLIENGRTDQLAEAMQRIPTDLSNHLDDLCWLWRKPPTQVPAPISAREMLIKMLNHLGEVTRNDLAPAEVVRDVRQKIRAALSADKYTRYHEVIEQMDAGVASTIYNQVERLNGLGLVLSSHMLGYIRSTYPKFFAKARTDPWLDEKIIFGTQAGMNKRTEELNHIVNVKIPENAKAIGDAAAHGDLSENSEYKFALEERDFLHARLGKIQNELNLAQLLTANEIYTDKVNIGTRVTLKNTETGEMSDMTILGPWESDIDNGIYNYQAPLCMKLKDLKIGDMVSLTLSGQETEYHIEAINNALED